MSDRELLQEALLKAVGEENCDVDCSAADIFFEDGKWYLRMPGFMEPWSLGSTMEEAKKTIRDLASMHFGTKD